MRNFRLNTSLSLLAAVALFTGISRGTLAAPGDSGGLSTLFAGDANLDGSLDVRDANLALRATLGLISLTAEQRNVADMNRDGQLNLLDVTLLLRALASGTRTLISTLPDPPASYWTQPVDQEPVDPHSDTLIASIGVEGSLHPDFGGDLDGTGPFGIPYVDIWEDIPAVPVSFGYDDESDPGPYPLPADAPIEGGPDSDGDRHVIVVDHKRNKLYELYYAFPQGDHWEAGSGAVWDMTTYASRPAGWTSADAAGLPIYPGLVRYKEAVEEGTIRHAIRFTVKKSRRGYVFPATHFASKNTDPSLPPMGMRVRLKASFDISPYPPAARAILQALKTYGMIVADNGSNWFMSGAPDPRWNDDDLNTLKRVKGSDFEVVKMGDVTTE
jgi:hypothetical protein